jgi:hypothetical protein
MAKIGKMPSVGRPEHPKDREGRLESEAYAKAHAAEYFEQYRADFLQLVAVYADDEAESLLSDLREHFWAQSWKPKSERGKKP